MGVRRYEGMGLPPSPRVAVIANDAIGNFVAAAPLLQMLRRELSPSEIHYYGGARTRELQEASDLFERHFDFHGTDPADLVRMLAGADHYDLVVNNESTPYSMFLAPALAGSRGFVVGPSLGDGGRGPLPFADDERGRLAADKQWIAPDLRSKYPFLESSFIGEIFCRVAYLDGPIPPYRVPTEEPPAGLPEVLIATAASLPEKLWPAPKWTEVLTRLRTSGTRVGLLGAKPSEQQKYWKGEGMEGELVSAGLVEDLRGSMSLPQVTGALAKARSVLTIDNGILHLAAAGRAPIVGLFRHGIHRLWAPPAPNLTVLTAGPDRSVADIEVDAVWQALTELH